MLGVQLRKCVFLNNLLFFFIMYSRGDIPHYDAAHHHMQTAANLLFLFLICFLSSTVTTGRNLGLQLWCSLRILCHADIFPHYDAVPYMQTCGKSFISLLDLFLVYLVKISVCNPIVGRYFAVTMQWSWMFVARIFSWNSLTILLNRYQFGREKVAIKGRRRRRRSSKLVTCCIFWW